MKIFLSISYSSFFLSTPSSSPFLSNSNSSNFFAHSPLCLTTLSQLNFTTRSRRSGMVELLIKGSIHHHKSKGILPTSEDCITNPKNSYRPRVA